VCFQICELILKKKTHNILDEIYRD
jgi:hypothetical protein